MKKIVDWIFKNDLRGCFVFGCILGLFALGLIELLNYLEK